MERLFEEDRWDDETHGLCADIIELITPRAKELCGMYNCFDVENLFHQAVTDLMLDIRLNLKHGDAWKV